MSVITILLYLVVAVVLVVLLFLISRLIKSSSQKEKKLFSTLLIVFFASVLLLVLINQGKFIGKGLAETATKDRPVSGFVNYRDREFKVGKFKYNPEKTLVIQTLDQPGACFVRMQIGEFNWTLGSDSTLVLEPKDIKVFESMGRQPFIAHFAENPKDPRASIIRFKVWFE
jgi:hypothetical protein